MEIKDKTVVGIIEDVTIFGPLKKINTQAKIDTGATKSSIDLALADDLGLGPVLRTKIIRSAEGSSQRPIVSVKIKFAGKNITEEFTIADRSKMRFPLLIGLNILVKGFIIDPEK